MHINQFKCCSVPLQIYLLTDKAVRMDTCPNLGLPINLGLQYKYTGLLPFSNRENLRECKREHVECYALKDRKLNIFKIIDRRISFYS